MKTRPTTLTGPMLALTLALAGCGSHPVLQKTEDWMQQLQAKTRSRGDKQIDEAPRVAQELACSTPGTRAARLEASQLLPERPRAGREVNHRLVVAACPVNTEDLTGRLTRRFVHDGRTAFEDSETVVLRPGRWAMDVFIGIPPQAPPGPYRLEVRFEGRGLLLDASSPFQLVGP